MLYLEHQSIEMDRYNNFHAHTIAINKTFAILKQQLPFVNERTTHFDVALQAIKYIKFLNALEKDELVPPKLPSAEIQLTESDLEIFE